MTTKLVALVLLCLMSGRAMAQEPKVTSFMSKDLTKNPGREVLMITAEHAPGGSSAIHRHNAHAFVYVLEGSVVAFDIDRGQFVPGRQCDDQIAMTQPAACHDQTVIRGARKGGDGALDLAGVARMDRAQLDPPSDGATESPAIPAVSIASVDDARAPASPRPRDRSRIAAA